MNIYKNMNTSTYGGIKFTQHIFFYLLLAQIIWYGKDRKEDIYESESRGGNLENFHSMMKTEALPLLV